MSTVCEEYTTEIADDDTESTLTDVKLCASMTKLFDAIADNKSVEELIVSSWLTIIYDEKGNDICFKLLCILYVGDNATRWGDSIARMLTTNTTLKYFSLTCLHMNQKQFGHILIWVDMQRCLFG